MNRNRSAWFRRAGFPRNPDISPPVVWCRFSPGPEGPSGRDGRDDRAGRAAEDETVRGPLLSLDHYDLAGSLEQDGRRMRMKTTLEITARTDPLTAATFTLNPDFDVYRVDYAGGDGALFTRQGTWLTVPFRHPVPRDSTTTLTFWYEGDVFRDGGRYIRPVVQPAVASRSFQRGSVHFRFGTALSGKADRGDGRRPRGQPCGGRCARHTLAADAARVLAGHDGLRKPYPHGLRGWHRRDPQRGRRPARRPNRTRRGSSRTSVPRWTSSAASSVPTPTRSSTSCKCRTTTPSEGPCRRC